MASRPKRWQQALDAIEEAIGSEVDGADFEGIADEYQEWLDGTPENLWGSPTTDKLEEVTGVADEVKDALEGFNDALASLKDTLNMALEVDLPRGFGRD
jgi:hypothetical protein